MDYMEIIKGFLLTSTGIVFIGAFGRFLWKLAGEITKKTSNTIDDSLYNITPKITREVLEEYDLGDKTEEILERILLDHKELPDDTSKMEKSIENEMKKLQKK